MSTHPKIIYHMAHTADWEQASASSRYAGSPDDLRDGFVHCSTAQQIRASAAKHRAGQSDLLLIELDSEHYADTLRWEPSPSGKVFPHIYGIIDPQRVRSVRPLPLDDRGEHRFPSDVG